MEFLQPYFYVATENNENGEDSISTKVSPTKSKKI